MGKKHREGFTPKYVSFTNGTDLVKVGCSYAGKMHYATAICSPEDKFDFDYGYKLAKARLDANIAKLKMIKSQRTCDYLRFCIEDFKNDLKEELEYEKKVHNEYLLAVSHVENILEDNI